MRPVFAVALFFLVGCPPPKPPTNVLPSQYPKCDFVDPTRVFVCDGAFTPDKIPVPCAVCGPAKACMDGAHGIYCVGAGGCSDCKMEATDVP